MMRSMKPVSAVDVSKNSKTGVVSATYAPLQSCPDTCKFKDNGCYAQAGNCNYTFGRVTKNTERMQLTDIEIAQWEAKEISKLEGDFPLRLHVSGDCKTNETAQIVSDAANEYCKIDNQVAWVYTHAWETVKRSSWGSVNVLASVENATDAKKAHDKGYSVAFVMPENKLADNVKAVVEMGLSPKLCNNYIDKTTCKKCRVCFDTDLSSVDVVILPTHGTGKNKADKACQESN